MNSNQKFYMIEHAKMNDGTEKQDQFTVKANNQTDADNKAFRWADRHGLTLNHVTARLLSDADAATFAGWFHPEYIPTK